MTIADNIVAADAVSSPGDRLRMIRIGKEDWLIHDMSFPENDARHLVACVRERGLDHVDVIWLQGRGLPAHFARVKDALDAAAEALPVRRAQTPAHPETWLG